MSKYLVRHEGGFYICNEGIAFGIHLPQAWLWLFILLFLAIFLILSFKLKILNELLNLKFNPPRRTNYSLIFIISGALSNVIDRLQFGCVIDFINPPIGPIFNLADVFISIGVIITVVSIYKHKQIL